MGAPRAAAGNCERPAVKTSAHTERDPGTLIAWTGTLIADAECRTKAVDAQGHMVPVLCMDIELDSHLRNRLHAEQPFPVGHHSQCEAAAHRYRKGMRVTVQAPIVGLRMVAPNLTHVHVHQPEETTP